MLQATDLTHQDYVWLAGNWIQKPDRKDYLGTKKDLNYIKNLYIIIIRNWANLYVRSNFGNMNEKDIIISAYSFNRYID